MKHEGLIESIRQRLLNASRANGEPFDYVLSRYGIERFLYRLGVSKLADQFVLKGASLFYVWNSRLHRPTRDLDLLGIGPNDPNSLRRIIEEIIGVPCPEDGLTFDTKSLAVALIREENEYGGVRAKFRATLGNVRIPIQIDVGYGDAITPGPEERIYPTILHDMPRVELKAYPTCTVIAEKFEALVRLDAQNTRMKDFFDLDFLFADPSVDRQMIRAAIHATFQRRHSSLPPTVPTGLTLTFAQDREVMWNAFLRKNGLQADDFSTVVARLREALSWVWNSSSALLQ
jgi:predicted nucleotidyltransferase component of viral defense system